MALEEKLREELEHHSSEIEEIKGRMDHLIKDTNARMREVTSQVVHRKREAWDHTSLHCTAGSGG